MILEDRLSRYLTRTKSSSFRPVIVQDLARIEDLYEVLSRKFALAYRRVQSVRGMFAFVAEARYRPNLNGILVCVTGPIHQVDLQALDLGRDDMAGAGLPVMWVMTPSQKTQVSRCSHLWSCRDLELYDGTTAD